MAGHYNQLAASSAASWTVRLDKQLFINCYPAARETTMMFKMDGDKLTGTMSGGQGGDAAFTDGKVDGNTVTFSIESQRGKRAYTGTIAGDEIKFKREGGQAPQEFTAKRAK